MRHEFKPHRMHEMRTIATDVFVAWCVCLSVTWLRPAKTVEVEVLFGVATSGNPKNIILDGVPISLWIQCGLHQITLTTCYGLNLKFMALRLSSLMHFQAASNALDADYCCRCSRCLSVCLSRGSTRLHCAKMAERIKMLLGMNTPGGRRILC